MWLYQAISKESRISSYAPETTGSRDLTNTRCLIRLCPNGHEVALVRSLEHVHRLVGFYPLSQ